jgi:glucose/arabinose dehydrogenase
MKSRTWRGPRALVAASALAMTAAATGPSGRAEAQTVPTVTDPNLGVRTVVSGLDSPIGIAFLGLREMLVLEKDTGRVKHVRDGNVVGIALDLAVNNSSERGLLGIALHPDFAVNRFVYLYWTCAGPHPSDPTMPAQRECDDEPQMGADTGDILALPLLGNRVDRFVWDGSTLAFDRNLIKLRTFQNDATNDAPNGNHNGGVLRFGAGGKLFTIVGDQGRRGQMQNLAVGPFGPGVPDDQFGGPVPDDAHLTGVTLRLNDDGTAPADNPFFALGAFIGGEVGANLQKVFAYGVRNGFGLAVDPFSGLLWDQQNGDDSFDEINLVEAGANLGWIQVMGPLARVGQFKGIETTPLYFGLQQNRWPPTNLADTPADAFSQLFMLPGARYTDPRFSWKYAVAPAGIGFLSSAALGLRYLGDLFVGAAVPVPQAGYILRFNLSLNRRAVAPTDPRLDDRVADNPRKYDLTESESLIFGRGFGIGTDIQTGPNGNLFVVSLSRGAVYEVFRR